LKFVNTATTEHLEQTEGEDIPARGVFNSRPTLTGFRPFGYQKRVLRLIKNHNYALCTPEILLSGSVGSAKSVLLAHVAVTHCLRNPGACVAICRRSLADLKKTIWKEIIEHISREGCMVEKIDYRKRDNTCEIEFSNGSVIMAVTWGDQRYDKFRSLKLSMLIIEELTENSDDFEPGFKILKARLRRIAWVKENILICATNPGEPDSFWHKYFIEGAKEFSSRFVFYSLTADNPFLDAAYLRQLLQDYSVLEAERYLRGQWISLEGKGIYHAYSEAKNFKKEPYKYEWTRPLHITFDFNVSEGKPQSAAAFQVGRDDCFHFFRESVIDNANWVLDNLDEFEAQGLFEGEQDGKPVRVQKVFIHGDATGKARSSNSLKSNYDLIKEWFAERGIPVQMAVPTINPALVKRWTTVNALCENALHEVRIFVYAACPVLNQGMKLSRKKPGSAIEDDSKRYQHITTALGYAVCYLKDNGNRKNKVVHDD
jgi:hypothetical protein